MGDIVWFDLPCGHGKRRRALAWLERGVEERFYCRACGQTWWMKFAGMQSVRQYVQAPAFNSRSRTYDMRKDRDRDALGRIGERCAEARRAS